MANGKLLAKIDAHASLVSSLAFTRDGRMLISASWDKSVKLWNVGTWTEAAALTHDQSATSMAISPDGQSLAVGTLDRSVVVWDIARRSITATLRPAQPAHGSTLVAYCPDGRMLAVGGDDIALWNLTDGRKTKTAPASAVRALACSSDGKTLAWTEQSGRLMLWDLASERQRKAAHHLKAPTIALRFSPNGRYLALGSIDLKGDNLRFVDVAIGTAEVSFPAHQSGVSALLFAGDGKTMASASWDGTVKLWDVSPLLSAK
jgi:WD40 repeat protein